MKIAITFILAGALAACGGKKSENNAGSGSATAVGSGSSAGSGSAMAAGSGSAMAAGSGSAAALDLPTEADFEDQATTDITEKNVDDKLSALEKDLGD